MKLNFSIFLVGQSWTSLCKSIFDIILINNKRHVVTVFFFFSILFLTLRCYWFYPAVRRYNQRLKKLRISSKRDLLIICIWGPQHRVHTLLVHIRFDCTNPIHDEISFLFSIVIFCIERANIPKLTYQIKTVQKGAILDLHQRRHFMCIVFCFDQT